MVSTNLPVMVTPGVSADVLAKLRVKRTVNKARINAKILMFFLLSILSSPFFIKILFPRNHMVKLVEICIRSVRSPVSKLNLEKDPHIFVLVRKIF